MLGCCAKLTTGADQGVVTAISTTILLPTILLRKQLVEAMRRTS